MKCSSEDYIDCAIISGVLVKDIVAGKISEAQISPDVISAYKLQYRNRAEQFTFVQWTRTHGSDPNALRGFISGVKGKVFESNYVQYLNAGHLPAGQTAELAHSSTQTGHDILIRDEHGAVVQLLQNKASACVSYVRSAIYSNPEIEHVLPTDVFEKLAARPEFAGRLVDGHETLADLHGAVKTAIDHANVGAIHLHFPEFAVAFAIAQNCARYRNGSVTLEEALSNVGSRSALAIAASVAAWAASAAAHTSLVGIPAAIATRLAGTQLMHNRERRKYLTARIETVISSRMGLQKI